MSSQTEVLKAFDDVGFAYQPDAWVLRGFSLRIGHGETLALVGAGFVVFRLRATART
mgnify:CR=1 FL=1